MTQIFKNFFSTLRHYKASSALNILGMAVSFAAFYIILTQVLWGFGYNQKIENSDRIFAVATNAVSADGKMNALLCRAMAESIIPKATNVEAYGCTKCFLTEPKDPYYIKQGDAVRKFSVAIGGCSEGAFDVFGYEWEQGSAADLSQPGAVAVSSAFAKEHGLKLGDHFSENPMGEPASNFIAAIWKDNFQTNSDLSRRKMLRSIGDENIDNFGEWGYAYYVKLRDAADKEQFEQRANQQFLEMLAESYGNDDSHNAMLCKAHITLIAYNDLYYNSDLSPSFKVTLQGNRTSDIALLAIALLTIAICLINFFNFFFALVPSRVKSVNTYMVFGTSRAKLIMNFIVEAIGLMLVSLLLAYVFVVVFLESPVSNVLFALAAPSQNIGIMLATLGIAVFTAIVGSVYPAYYITSFKPAFVLKGSFGTSRSGRILRNTLIGIQLTVSIALIICTVFIHMQNQYMLNYDMGFTKSYLITGRMPAPVAWWSEKNSSFENELRKNPDIRDLTWSDGSIVDNRRMTWKRTINGKEVTFQVFPVAWNFPRVIGIDVIDGRDFSLADEQSENGVVMFNDKAKKDFEIEVNNLFPGHRGDNAEIVGISSGYHDKPLQYGIEPMALYVFGKDHSWRNGLTQLYVRTAPNANAKEVMNYIKKTVIDIVPNVDPDEIELSLFDKELAMRYEKETKLSTIITIFALIAVIISLMGVFGIVLFETQYRKREIAVRKVLGAEVRDVIGMINRRFAIIVALSFAVAAPISWIIIDHYLSTFAYRMPVHIWVFAVILLLVLALTLAVVTIRCWQSARQNPINNLKSE